MEMSAARETEADEHGHEERASGRGAARSSGTVGAELASLVTILVREPGRVTAGGGEPLVLSRGVKRLLQRVVHRAGQKRAQIPCLYLLQGGGVTTGYFVSTFSLFLPRFWILS